MAEGLDVASQWPPASWGQKAKGLRPIERSHQAITRAARESETGESFGRKWALVASKVRPV
jgi:hypothetical protein